MAEALDKLQVLLQKLEVQAAQASRQKTARIKEEAEQRHNQAVTETMTKLQAALDKDVAAQNVELSSLLTTLRRDNEDVAAATAHLASVAKAQAAVCTDAWATLKGALAKLNDLIDESTGSVVQAVAAKLAASAAAAVAAFKADAEAIASKKSEAVRKLITTVHRVMAMIDSDADAGGSGGGSGGGSLGMLMQFGGGSDGEEPGDGEDVDPAPHYSPAAARGGGRGKATSSGSGDPQASERYSRGGGGDESAGAPPSKRTRRTPVDRDAASNTSSLMHLD